MTKAKMERRLKSRVLPELGIITNERAVLRCGCCVWVGVRMDNKEVATASQACCEPHVPVMERFNDLLRESIARPRKVLLVKVCAELLTATAREFGL